MLRFSTRRFRKFTDAPIIDNIIIAVIVNDRVESYDIAA